MSNIVLGVIGKVNYLYLTYIYISEKLENHCCRELEKRSLVHVVIENMLTFIPLYLFIHIYVDYSYKNIDQVNISAI